MLRYEQRLLVRRSYLRASRKAGWSERKWARRTAGRFGVSERTVRDVVAKGADTDGLRERRGRDKAVRALAVVVDEVVLSQPDNGCCVVRRRLGGNKSKLGRTYKDRTGEGIARATIRAALSAQPTPAEPRRRRA